MRVDRHTAVGRFLRNRHHATSGFQKNRASHLHARHSGNRTSEKFDYGYTLLEIVLAVSVLVVLASLGVSPVLSTWRDNRLAGAAEDVRSLLAGSRFQSIDRDQVWQFRYEPGGTMFMRVPVNIAPEGEQTENTDTGRLSGSLPEGITFAEDSTGTEAEGAAVGTTLSPDMFSGLPDANELTATSWSDPIYFYPDGTSETAEFDVKDDYGSTRVIKVRDLTGAVTVSRPADSTTRQNP